MFFRELLWGEGIAPRFIVLWLSRLLYIVFFLFYIFIIKGNKIYIWLRITRSEMDLSCQND